MLSNVCGLRHACINMSSSSRSGRRTHTDPIERYRARLHVLERKVAAYPHVVRPDRTRLIQLKTSIRHLIHELNEDYIPRRQRNNLVKSAKILLKQLPDERHDKPTQRRARDHITDSTATEYDIKLNSLNKMFRNNPRARSSVA